LEVLPVIRSAAAALLLCIPSISFAAPDYRCVIESFASADSSIDAFHRAFIGRELTVERRTGITSGALKNSVITQPTVIDPGTPGNSYKVISALRPGEGHGPGSNVNRPGFSGGCFH
jgi:hypothetical protein